MTNKPAIKLIECPRDAMQGIKEFIPTSEKIRYINALIKVGFDTIDFGSFVSPMAIPQMRDTADVLRGLDLEGAKSKLLAIVANKRGADDACHFDEINYLGFPLSVSETFQQKNTNKTIDEAFATVAEIQNLCIKHKKTQVVYLSMGFGNPYGDPYDKDYILDFSDRLHNMGIRIMSLSDTIGVSDKENIHFLFSNLIPAFPDVEFGAHMHSTPDKIMEKLDAAYKAGCRRFDGALKGFGGCPMAKDELTGNMATEVILAYFRKHNIDLPIHQDQLQNSMLIASEVFPQ